MLPMAEISPSSQEPVIRRVSTIELFFDLVFVFAVTQLTSLIAHPHEALDYLKAALVFFTLMWMYDGFAWLTSNVRVQSNRDYWMLTAAMSAFLVMSFSIPTIFEGGGLPYGVGLLVVTLVHAIMFRQAGNSSSRAILTIVPYNLGSGLCALGAAFAPQPWKWVLWGLAVFVPILSTLCKQEGGFTISPEHFVERHGLLIIVALGESVVGIGQGASGLTLTIPLLAYAVLGLYLAICIWASYFDEDDQRAEHALVHAPPENRTRMALIGFGYCHFLMIAGIILTAAGLEVGIHQPLEPSGTHSAWNLGVGLALYLVGDIGYRRTMGIGPNLTRAAILVLTLMTGFLGESVNALVQLFVCACFFTALWSVD